MRTALVNLGADDTCVETALAPYENKVGILQGGEEAPNIKQELREVRTTTPSHSYYPSYYCGALLTMIHESCSAGCRARLFLLHLSPVGVVENSRTNST